MRRAGWLAIAIFVTAACSGRSPQAAAPTPTAAMYFASPIVASPQPCVDDDSNNTPCPGTPEPTVYSPLPPSGAIPDDDVPKRVPASVSAADRALIVKVMLATKPDQRDYIRWVYCHGHIFVYSGWYQTPDTPSAFKVLNDDPSVKSEGGDYINPLTCDDFPMPGA